MLGKSLLRHPSLRLLYIEELSNVKITVLANLLFMFYICIRDMKVR